MKAIFKITWWPAVLLGVLFFPNWAGAQMTDRQLSHTPVVIQYDGDVSRLPSSGERIFAMENSIAKIMLLRHEKLGRFPSGQVQVEFQLENMSPEENLFLQWKVVFYDGGNSMLEETEWKTQYFPPNDITHLKANSIGPDAENFAVILRVPPSHKAHEAVLRAEEAAEREAQARKDAEKARRTNEEAQKNVEGWVNTLNKLRDGNNAANTGNVR